MINWKTAMWISIGIVAVAAIYVTKDPIWTWIIMIPVLLCD